MQTIEISDVQEQLMNDLKEIKNVSLEVTTHGPFQDKDSKSYNVDSVKIKFEHFELYLQGKPYLDEVENE